MELKGKNVVVTGASRGLGVHIARTIAERGVNLALVARTAGPLEALASELGRAGVRAVAVATDLGDTAAYPSLCDRIESALGPVDVLVNNAAIEANSRYAEFPPERIEEMIRLDLIAPMLLTRALLPRLLQRKSGHIVNISSLAGKMASPWDVTYAAAKGGITLFTLSLRAELRGSGVSCSVIAPGMIAEGMFAAKQRDHGVKAPAIAGISSPGAVARSVVKAIEHDRAEILVNPGPIQLFNLLAQAAPDTMSRFFMKLGVSEPFRAVAEAERGNALSS